MKTNSDIVFYENEKVNELSDEKAQRTTITRIPRPEKDEVVWHSLKGWVPRVFFFDNCDKMKR